MCYFETTLYIFPLLTRIQSPNKSNQLTGLLQFPILNYGGIPFTFPSTTFCFYEDRQIITGPNQINYWAHLPGQIDSSRHVNKIVQSEHSLGI
jgi:hypothetical protein